MKKYQIPSRIEEELEPEEVLFYDGSQDGRIVKSYYKNKDSFILFIALFALILFGFRFFQLQIIKGDYFKALALENQYRSYIIQPARGIVFDSTGRVLAGNKETYDVIFFPRVARAENVEEEAIKTVFIDLLHLGQEKVSEVAESNSEIPLFIKTIYNKELKEQIEKLSLPGLMLVSNLERDYPFGSTSAHILGYVNELSRDEVNADLGHFGQLRGRSGLEEKYDDDLNGKVGEVGFDKDDIKKTIISNPQSGNSLVTSIDIDLQNILNQEIQKALAQLGLKKAAAVVQDPRTGAILAMASFPSFDNNIFVSTDKREELVNLLKDQSQPLFNRVISGRLSPGSTIKPLIALAALEEGVITPQKKLFTTGYITIPNQYNSSVVYTFRDWKNHGIVDMIKAIADSVDVYFYTVGGGYYDIKGLGVERIVRYIKIFLADKTLGIDIPGEVSGLVPFPERKLEIKGEPWYLGDTYNLSIGQGDLLVTPLWLNTYIGSLANGGRIYKPFIVKKIVSSDGDEIKSTTPEVLEFLNFNPENLKVIQLGMRAAVTEGTVWRLKDFPVPVAGKTGSAEVIKGQSTNAWLSAFAPYDNPEIMITVMIERGGHGENFPAQIVKRVFQWYFYKN